MFLIRFNLNDLLGQGQGLIGVAATDTRPSQPNITTDGTRLKFRYTFGFVMEDNRRTSITIR